MAGIVVWLALSSSGALPLPAAKLTGILVFTVIWWICEPIPMAATALLSPLLCIVFGLGKASEVLAPFSSTIIFLFIGSFLLAEAARKHGLDRRLALSVLGLPGVTRSPWTVLLAIGTITAFLSMWMSNTAVTALMLPVALGLMKSDGQLNQPRMAASLMLMLSFAATAGGLATPIGTPPNLIGKGLLKELTGHDVTFLSWMTAGLPLSLLLIGVLVWLLRPKGVVWSSDHEELTESLRRQTRSLGGMSRAERNVTLVFTLALMAWLYPSVVTLLLGKGAGGAGWFEKNLPEDMVGLGMGLLLFILPVHLAKWEFTVDWRDAAKIDWGTILLFGGGMAMGKQMTATGLDKAMGAALMHWLGTPGPWTVMAVGIVAAIVLSEFTSNTAAVNVVMPLMIALATAAHVDPVPVGLATCLACSFGFMLPVSTAPNAIVFGSGRVPLQRMMSLGIRFDVIGAVLIWVWMVICGKWIG